MVKLTKDQMEQDIKAHGKWLVSGEGTPIDWSGQDLSEISSIALVDVDLSGADMRGALLRSCDLSDADLCSVDMREADMREANLLGALVKYANFGQADMRGALIDYVSLADETDLWDGAIMDGVRLHKDGSLLSVAESEPLIKDLFAQKGISIGVKTVDLAPAMPLVRKPDHS